jgi:hypothetical protein
VRERERGSRSDTGRCGGVRHDGRGKEAGQGGEERKTGSSSDKGRGGGMGEGL